MERAPEPTDVYWENLKVTSKDRLKLVAKTYLISLVVIAVCFVITYAVNMFKDSFSKSDSGKITTKYGSISIVNLVTSFVVVIINNSLRIVVRRFSMGEKHATLTAYNISVAFKLTMARFINTSIIPIVVNLSYDSYYKKGGLVSDVFYLILAISFFDPITYFFDMFYMIKLISRCKEKRKGQQSTIT